jgi:hypothetical protein
MLGRVLRYVAGKIVATPIRRQIRGFEAATLRPRETQEALLRRILAFQADTDFGRAHHFRDIRTPADFRRHLPVSGYEYFEPYLERVRRGDLRALLADPCVHMFALSSGTTAARKYIPVTPQYLADYRRGWNIWGLKTYRDHPEVKLRPIVQISGDWDESRTEAGIPCGAVTGLTATMQKRIIRLIYCVPPCIGKIKDATAKYYLVLRLSAYRPVGMVIAANPSTLIAMARTGNQEKESLIRDLYDGTLDARFEIPANIRALLARRIRRRRVKRARELEAAIEQTGTLYPRQYWSENCLLGNWTGGSVGAYLTHYPLYFGHTPVRDVGLVASEGRMTIPMADGTPGGVLDITSHYFEFIPEDEIDRPQPTVLAAHEVLEGRKYFIIPTTAFGLYRYHISDVVRVAGFHKGTPIVEFLSKGSHFANITGEKLSEYHVTRAMQQVLHELNLSVGTYTLAPCWNDVMPYYGLFVERGDFAKREQAAELAQALDDRLCRLNEEYASKRGSLRLGTVRIELLSDGAWAAWDQQRLIRTGGTLEQYKHPCLVGDLSFRNNMSVEEELAVPDGSGSERRVG